MTVVGSWPLAWCTSKLIIFSYVLYSWHSGIGSLYPDEDTSPRAHYLLGQQTTLRKCKCLKGACQLKAKPTLPTMSFIKFSHITSVFPLPQTTQSQLLHNKGPPLYYLVLSLFRVPILCLPVASSENPSNLNLSLLLPPDRPGCPPVWLHIACWASCF